MKNNNNNNNIKNIFYERASLTRHVVSSKL